MDGSRAGEGDPGASRRASLKRYPTRIGTRLTERRGVIPALRAGPH